MYKSKKYTTPTIVKPKNIIKIRWVRTDAILNKQEKNKNINELLMRPSMAGGANAN
jgi:hypothetical protein